MTAFGSPDAEAADPALSTADAARGHSDGLGLRRVAWIYLACLAAASLTAYYQGALDAGFSEADESSHFLNTFLIWQYLGHGLGGNPLAFAQDLYLFYPKISIGHWPPLYYALIAPLFFVLPVEPATAMAINVVVAMAPAALIALVVGRFAGWRWALAAGLLYATVPVVLMSERFFHLDQAVAAVGLGGAIVWARFAAAPSYRLSIAYGMLAGAAILIKGNGWILGLLPAFHIMLSGRWALLIDRKTYVGAAVALGAVVPWQLVTMKISSDGFMFEAGLGYTLAAIRFNVGVLWENLGALGLVAAALAAGVALRKPYRGSEFRHAAELCAALILATITLQSLVPVALAGRYMAPALAATAILTVMAVVMVLRSRFLAGSARMRAAVAVAAVAVLALPGAMFLWKSTPKGDLRMDLAAAAAMSTGAPRITVIDGSSGAEGALIAEVAVRDSARSNYVVRASKLLSRSNYLGGDYELLAATPAAAAAALRELGVGAVVLERRPGMAPYPHGVILLQALEAEGSEFRRAATLRHRNRDGVTHVFVRKQPIAADLDRLREVNFAKRQAKLGP